VGAGHGGPSWESTEGVRAGQQLLVACVRCVFDESYKSEVVGILDRELNWIWVFNTAFSNRLFSFLHHALREFPDRVPGNVHRFLADNHTKVARRNAALQQAARAVTGALEDDGIPAIVMRGVSFLETIYRGRLGLRDFGDVDLLVKRDDLDRVKTCLRRLGFGPEPGALDDRYYERHHLHLAWSRGPAQAAVEIHWSLDHKYTSYTIDSQEVFRRARWVDLPAGRLLLMDPEDTLIAACVHAFKHDPLVLHYWSHLNWARPEFPERHLVHLADLLGLLSSVESFAWTKVTARSRRWRASESVWALLMQARDVLDLEVPEEVLVELRPPDGGWVERRAARTAHGMLRRSLPSNSRRAAVARLFRYRHGLVFDPVRLVDLSGYLFPSVERAKLRWGCRTSAGAVLRILGHLVRSSASLGRNLIDAMYYGAKRRLSGPRRKQYRSPLQTGSG
jgi:hypothetical protein